MKNDRQQDYVPFASRLFLSIFISYLMSIGMSGAADPVQKPFTTDELLGYTLQDLQGRINEIGEENRKLSEKNGAIRKRILVFQDEIRKLNDRKIELQDEKNELANNVEYGAREVSIWQRKQDNADLLYDQLKQRRTHLENFITEQKRRQGQLQKQLTSLQESLRDLKQKKQDRDKASDDKSSISQLTNRKQDLKEARDRVRDLSQSANILEKKTVALQRDHDRLLDDNQVLTSKLDNIRAASREILNEKQKLQEKGQRLKNEINTTMADQRTEIGQWRTYRNNLRDAVDKQREVNNQIQDSFIQQQGQILRWDSWLLKQKELLTQKRDILQKTFDSIRLAGEQERQSMQMRENTTALSQTLQQLRVDQRIIKNNIEKAKKQKPLLIQRHKSLIGQVATLQNRLKSFMGKAKVLHRSAKKESKQKLVHLSSSEKKNIQRLQGDIALSTRRAEDYNQRLTLVREKNRDLKAKLQERQMQSQAAAQENEKVQQRRKEITKDQTQPQDGIQQEIDNLKLRRDVLASSLTAIESRYHSQELAVEEFTQEQEELNEYFSILKDENNGLQEKARSLMEGLERKSPE